jgi:heptosyltransferase-2
MRIGYLGEARVGLLTHRLKNPRKGQRPPMVAFYSALSGDTDIAGDQPHLQMEPIAVDQALADMGLRRGGYYVFAPGAEYGPAKRWPAAHFSELARMLELPVVLLGSGKEAALCEEIATPVNAVQPGKCLNLAGKTSLEHAFIAIAATKNIVSNDSGLMHVAAALGVPQVALFGSSSPMHTPPLNNLAKVLWLKDDASYQPPLDCAPCFERECPLGHTRCLVDIRPAEVLRFLHF